MLQVIREQAAVDDRGEPGRSAGAVFVLAGERTMLSAYLTPRTGSLR
ncbi:hypothetical protein ACFRFU_47195 [Streptomyces sp. NPDC056704]